MKDNPMLLGIVFSEKKVIRCKNVCKLYPFTVGTIKS
jgi:hypothetical protein